MLLGVGAYIKGVTLLSNIESFNQAIARTEHIETNALLPGSLVLFCQTKFNKVASDIFIVLQDIISNLLPLVYARLVMLRFQVKIASAYDQHVH